ncbi:hypothetical protein H632_c811p1 [Helicosporidium sp. ATCC 50920]|nr:hypothetical protein H632_c811p1 [Helicosporidium sp. ATCC 50920]|eukprot:KDD75205.1 hypothetical protein H632_c811p1 [Helicosporidium sp. ATCC 50920]
MGVGKVALSHNGVITDVRSYGDRKLAYTVRRPGEKHTMANMWQMSFATKGGALKEIEHGLRVNEQVLRWIVLKREMLSKLPNTYKVARKAESAMAKREASAVTTAT